MDSVRQLKQRGGNCIPNQVPSEPFPPVGIDSFIPKLRNCLNGRQAPNCLHSLLRAALAPLSRLPNLLPDGTDDGREAFG